MTAASQTGTGMGGMMTPGMGNMASNVAPFSYSGRDTSPKSGKSRSKSSNHAKKQASCSWWCWLTR